MEGNQLPVLTLDIDESKIKALNEIAEKFKAAFAIGPGGFPVQQSSQQPSSGFGSPDAKNKKGEDSTFDTFFKNLNKEAKGTLKTFTAINKTLWTTTSTLKSLFTNTISWGAKIAAIGGGGAFGYDYMARQVAKQYQTAQGAGVTTGQHQAAHNVYGTRIANADNILQSLANAQEHPSDPHYAGLINLGLNPQDSPAKNLPKVIERVASLLKQYKGSGAAQEILKGYRLDDIFDPATSKQLLANSDRLPQFGKEFAQQSQRLDRDMGSGTQQSWQDLSAKFLDNTSRLGNTFTNALGKLNGPIGRISDELTDDIETFLNGRNGQALFDTFANGLKQLGDWLAGDDFQNDLKTFADCVKQIISVLGDAIKWIAGTTDGVNLNGAGVGLDGANKAYVAFGNKYLGGKLPGANPMTNQYTGEFFKEEDVSTKYRMPDAMKTNVQTFVEAVNKTANLPNGLMPAIAQKESSWNPLALNSSGAAGLFQFMPGTAKAYGLEGYDVYDPNKATVAAGRYLNDLNKRYKGDVAKMLTSYNGGRIDKDGNLSLKKETVEYLLKILPQVQGATEQHPGIIRQLEAANTVLSKGGGNDRTTISLQIVQKAGSDISAQLLGQSNPG